MMVTGIHESAGAASDPDRSKHVPSRTKESGLGRDAFMKLMLAQMRNQDPLEPMKNSEFLAQLAQFNALEEMKNLNESFNTLMESQQMLQASMLIGKQVSGLGADGDAVSGVVSSVRSSGGNITLYIGEQAIPLENVHTVEEAQSDGG
jgi:flagellar basal-body rod modification protein FlgD